MRNKMVILDLEIMNSSDWKSYIPNRLKASGMVPTYNSGITRYVHAQSASIVFERYYLSSSWTGRRQVDGFFYSWRTKWFTISFGKFFGKEGIRLGITLGQREYPSAKWYKEWMML